MGLNPNSGIIEETQRAIGEVSEAVLASGNSGKIVIELTFARNGDSSSRQIVVKDKLKVTQPTVAKPSTLFFVSHEGGLTRQNPNQPVFTGMGAQ